jgi:toxin ParE1/3/4
VNHLVRPRFYLDVTEEVTSLAEKAGATVATRWADAVWDTFGELDAFPMLGRERTDLPFAGVRSWRVKGFPRWLIFYGVREDTIVFYRVRHGAMNLVTLDLEH